MPVSSTQAAKIFTLLIVDDGRETAYLFADGRLQRGPTGRGASARLARRLAGSPSLVLRCRLAGLLHDVGKVLVPAAILAKPGPLDEEEWRLVRLHPVHGEGLLAAVPDLRPIAPIVRQHHERFDGTGYPDGLAGEEILLEARIVAVAECWIAMTSPRPHRPALSEAEALRELEAAAGHHLDARLIDALRSVLTHPREADARGAQVP